MANGELEIKGIEKVNEQITKIRENLSGLVNDLAEAVKATNKDSEAKKTQSKNISDLNKEINSQDENEKKNNTTKEKANKAQKELTETTARAAQLTRDKNELTKAEAVLNDKNAGTLEKLSADNKKLAIERKNLNLETVAGQMRLKEINAQLDINNDKIRENSDSLKQQKINIGNYASGTASLREQMKFLTMELVKMKMAGEEDSATYKEMVQKLGDLKDSMADVAAEAKVMGSDTKSIDMFVGSIKAVGSAGQIAESTMQLLGSENEDVTKGIQRMMAIQTMMNGVQEIGNALQKESAFMLGLNAAGTKLAAAGQAIYTFAVGASTGALKAFRIAMLATGIGALIAGLALLVVNFDKVKKAIFGGNDELERFGKLTNKYNLVADIKNKKIKDEIELLKAKGATDDEIAKKEREMMLNDIAATEAKIAENKKLQESAKGDQLKGLENQENALNNSLHEQERLLEVFDEQNKTRRRKELEEENKKNKKKDEIQKESIEITRQNTKSDYEIRLENQKEGEKLMQEAILKGKQEAWEITKETIQENYDEEINMLNEQYVKEIEAAKGNEEQIKQINDNYNLMMQVAEIDKWTAILATAQKGSQDEKTALIALSELKKSIAITTAQTEIDAQRDLKEKEFEILKLRRAAMIQFGEGVGNATALFLTNQEDAARQSLKNMVKAALEALKAYAYIQLGIATVGSMASAESIATWGIAGAIKAAALAALIEGAVTVAEAGSNSLIDQFAKGTKDAPGGAAILGEGTGIYAGRELVTLPDGTKFLTQDHATLYPNLPKHSVVTPANMVEQELRKSFENTQLSKNDNKFMSDIILRDMNKNLKMLTKKNTAVHIHGMNVGYIDMVNNRYRK